MGPGVSLIFLDMMTRHHQGAIDMAREELACSQDARVKELAIVIDAR